MSDPQATTPQAVSEDPKSLVQTEYDEATRALKEITLMLEQSRVEVGKLTQRNAAVTAHLQQIQNQINKIPGDEVKICIRFSYGSPAAAFCNARSARKITKRSGKSGKIPEHSGTPAEDDGFGRRDRWTSCRSWWNFQC